MTRAANDNITAAFRVGDLNTEIDREPRVLDVLLGERLGFARPRKVRELVARNEPELLTYGGLPRRRANLGIQGGRPSEDVFLNEPQALLICMFANTAKAAQVRKMLIDVFMEYRRSQGMVKVQAHERRTSTHIDKAISLTRSADRLERATANIAGIAAAKQTRYLTAMVIDGEPVVVDVHDHDIEPRQRAVVMKHSGELAIERVERLDHNPSMFAKSRSAYGPRKPSPYGGTMREAVVIVGKVIERAAGEMRLLDTPAGRKAEQLAAPRATALESAKRRVVVGKLALAGKSNKEIVAVTGAPYSTVSAWARGVRQARSGRTA